MQLHIRLFANLREALGAPEVTVEITQPIQPSDLITLLKTTYPDQKTLFDHVLVARNQQLASPDALLAVDDELALLPPVGGGEQSVDKRAFVALSETPLLVEDAYRLLEDVHHGGTVLFMGTVREWTGEQQTSHLIYEAYKAMALLQMEQIQAEVEAAYPGTKTLQWHRIGRLVPTDIAVICGAASPHRDDAFAAARMLIERLKKEVAIWKKETFVNGQAEWRANAQIGDH